MKRYSKTRVTLKDIAEQCQYSVNTISRAMRNDEKLPQSTRTYIQQLAAQMGYVPNSNASALRSGSTKTISIIVNDLRNPHFSSMLDQMERKLREAGYNTMILCTHLDLSLGEQMIHVSISHCVDGILYFPYHSDRECIEYMKRCGVPFVLIDRWINGVMADTARTDDELGGYIAGQHLLQQGHTNFVYIAGSLANSSQIDRQAGFFRALSEKHIPQEQIQIIPWDDVEAARQNQQMRSLLLPTKATAVLCFNDTLAYHLMNELNLEHIRVPEDISILSFDYIRRAFPYMPPLSSISTTFSSVAEVAVQLLLNRIHDTSIPPQIVVLPVQIFDEGTTAPPRTSEIIG